MAGIIDEYLAVADAEQRAQRATNPTDGRVRRVVEPLIPLRWRGTVRVMATNAVRVREARRAARLVTSRPLLLHLGSGPEHKKGWINIDLIGDPVDLAWDLARPLPFGDGTVDGIFHEHLLEHLPLRSGAKLTRECARVLRSGGTLRIGVPDVAALIEDYVKGTGELLARNPGRPTAMLALQEMFYWHRHCAMYDFETLDTLLRWAGFGPVTRFEWGESPAFDPTPDSESRRGRTLYIETNAL